MPMPIAAAMAAAGAMSAIGSMSSARQAAKSSQKQMDFQERMSSTSHQREVKDLRLAGLNPILSAGGSGASTPAGSMTTPGNPLEGAANTMLQIKLAQGTLKEQNQKIKNLIQDQDTSSALEGKLLEESAGANMDWQIKEVQHQLLKYKRNEARSESEMYKTIGTGGKGIQTFFPMFMKMFK